MLLRRQASISCSPGEAPWFSVREEKKERRIKSKGIPRLLLGGGWLPFWGRESKVKRASEPLEVYETECGAEVGVCKDRDGCAIA